MTDINAQMTEYLTTAAHLITDVPTDQISVEYSADEERTTIIINDAHYDCISGSDDDAFVFICTVPPHDRFTIEFPDADWFNEF